MQRKKIAKKSVISEQKSKMPATQGNMPVKSFCMNSVWKAIAVLVVVIFVLFIIGGIIKSHHFRSSIVKPAQEQIDYAKAIATEKLQLTGENASAYEIRVAGTMRKIPLNGVAQNIIQVSFYSNATTHMYLVNLGSGEVILHSQTDVYKEIGSPKPGCGKDDDKCNKGFNEDIKRDKDPEFRSPWFSRGFFGRR